MPLYVLDRRLLFPDPRRARDGLLAVGGDLSPERLLLGYRSGIFPWYHDDLPILWHSPDPRCVIPTDAIHVSRSLARVIKHGEYEVRYDTVFARVIRGCKEAPRIGQEGTWITDDMEAAYVRLHALGYAHSVEAWHGGELAGGLYGVCLGRMFFGESMFSRRSNASKVALVTLVRRMRGLGARFIDAQVENPLTAALGAVEWPREEYLARLAEELAAAPEEPGPWTGDPGGAADPT